MKVVSSNVYVAHMFGVEFYANANLVNLLVSICASCPFEKWHPYAKTNNSAMGDMDEFVDDKYKT